jgi:hypothetical protein
MVDIAQVDDEMRTLLRSWAACMQKPRPKDWEKITDNLYKDTRLLLGDISAAEFEAQHPAEDVEAA